MANTTPRPKPEPDPPFGRPLTSWDLPKPTYYNYNDYYNNYESQAWSYHSYESQAWSYNNYESQAWSYNNYESNRYNHVSQSVHYEPTPPAQYYSVAEPPPQQRHYCPPPPSYTPMSDVDATLETDVNDSEIRVDARGDEIAAESPLEEIGEDESPPTVEPKLEVTDADASYEQQLS